MLLEHLELSTRGKWAEGYGRVFRLYVDDKVRKANLPVKNHGGRKNRNFKASWNRALAQ